VGVLSASPSANEYAEAPPTPTPPHTRSRAEGGEKKADIPRNACSSMGEPFAKPNIRASRK